jgi:hypothetical protein
MHAALSRLGVPDGAADVTPSGFQGRVRKSIQGQLF